MNPMRFIGVLLLFTVSGLSAQNMKKTDYGIWWKKIDALLEKEGRSKSALTEVNALFVAAQKDKAEDQQVKATLYRIQLEGQLQEGSDTLSIELLQQQIRKSTGIQQSLYQCLLGDFLRTYYNQHRWQLYNRTAVLGNGSDNIQDWGPAAFHEAIRKAYLAALENKALLQRTKLENYEAVIVKGNARELRPTLFDLVAWHALDYFKSEPSDLNRSGNSFGITDPSLLEPASSFVKYRFSNSDSSSHHWQALKLFQELLRFHQPDNIKNAFLDADLARLQFIQEEGNIPNKTSLYRKALEQLITNIGSANSGDAVLDLARSYSSEAPVDKPKAVSLAEPLVVTKNERIAALAFNFLEELRRPEIALTVEKVNLPDLPFRCLLKYSNLKKTYWSVYPLTTELRDKLRRGRNIFQEESWSELRKSKAIRNWEQELPVSTDYAKHSIELKVDALPAGEYVLLAAADPAADLNKTTMSAVILRNSNISFINNDDDYFILHRNTGLPLAKASIQLWQEKYDPATRKYIQTKAGRYLSNDQGYFNISQAGLKNWVTVDISYQNDRLFLDDQVYHYVNQPGTTKDVSALRNARSWFFLDRAIYRPGQTMQFKAIAITRDPISGKSSVLVNQPVTVLLLNANGEKVDSAKLTTNEYGSYSGKFNLPAGGLTGGFQLQQTEWEGNAYFQVEEYKRPKFQVELLPVEGSYRVNDSITVKGMAKAYAGNAITDANITYRVTRKSRMLFPWRRFWPPIPDGGDVEIINGKATTGKDGSFAIRFAAIPDLSFDKSTDPVFDYELSVDVTDLNGETRSGKTFLSVSYKALTLEIADLAETMAVDSLQLIKLFSKNTGGQFEAAKLNLSLVALQAPDRLIRARFWDMPDQFIYSEKEFLQYFPTDEYKKESDPNSWTTGNTIWQQNISTTAEGSQRIEWKNRTAGWYKILATGLDKYGDTISAEKTVYLYDPKAKDLPAPAYLFATKSQSAAAPGDKLQFLIGSSVKDLFLISQRENNELEKNARSLPFAERFQTEKLISGISTKTYTVQEADRGGIGWMQFFVQNNRVYTVNERIDVPWSNKELDIRVSSFRDKTLPGSEEKWTVTISGKKGEKVAAELLGGMYDASLDQFAFHQWNKPDVWPQYTGRTPWNGQLNFSAREGESEYPELKTKEVKPIGYDHLLSLYLPGNISRTVQGRVMLRAGAAPAPPQAEMSKASAMDEVVVVGYGATRKKELTGSVQTTDTKGNEIHQPQSVSTRTDFRETAFFFPQLTADASGNYQFNFTMPEALTSWKWQLLAHTKDLSFGYLAKNIVTQKELMVQPNMPRFLREGDRMEISAKIVNLSDKEMTGQAELQLIDPVTNEPVDGWFRNFFPNQYFTVAAGGSEAVKFPVEVPYLYGKALTWKVIARSGEKTDGESASLPVLSNRELVTETLPFFLNGSSTKHLTFKKLLESAGSETLSNRSLTVEFSSNPAWYAVQALPYLNDYPYECAEQTFNRLYANLLAGNIVSKLPRIKAVLEKWAVSDTAALISNLQKNAELKQVLLEETPWVMAAQTETEQKKKIASLFNLVQLAANTEKIATQLAEMQTSNGGFSWFKGGPDDRYITQYILTGIGRLKQLGALPESLQQLPEILRKALPYLDARIREDYDKRDKKNENAITLNDYAAQYLYMRSYFTEIGIEGPTVTAANYYRKQTQANWIKGSRQLRGMIAITLQRTGDKITAAKILKSLDETAVRNEELGMYWKETTAAYYWRDAPIETHAVMIEAFQSISADEKSVAALKTWLLKNKQTSHWSSSKATADACYALLLQGSNWLEAEPKVSVQLGKVTTVTATQAEAGTGYYQKMIPGTAVFPEMGEITVKAEHPLNSNNIAPVWGAVYWQYFEEMDKISAAASPLTVKKMVMVERLNDKGAVLEPYTDGMSLKVGDKLKIRLSISSDRAMEYIHVKDLRASNLEPLEAISGYKWQGGLGYYQSPRDASMNFFISYLPKGDYVLEYGLFVNQAGQFSNGIAKAQSMYAPEFSSHSAAVSLRVE